jgi:hypothetical protein
MLYFDNYLIPFFNYLELFMLVNNSYFVSYIVFLLVDDEFSRSLIGINSVYYFNSMS